ncbi:cytochrome P450 [Rhizosaccharibacter radicis]|uniref:Cytochrome P450 n=1 Tax=Rhizosaccharibacter radicis TaxID=2782605 RepID=A0ABT1W280_9PROT|nr:cytochrome P450 [Acetobacteraceae bacterium KSS12]
MELPVANADPAILRLPSRMLDVGRTLRATLTNPLDGLPPEIFHADLVRRTLLRRNVTYVMAPALVQEALVARAAHLDKGESVRRPLGAALGNGLLTAEDEDWRWQRRAIAPVFRAGALDRFTPAMLAAAGRCADRMATAGALGPVSVSAEMMRTTFEIIADTMLSGHANIDVERTAADVSGYLRQTRWANLSNLMGLPGWAPHPGKRGGRRIAAYLRQRLGEQVAVRRAAPGAGDDLVTLLLAAADPDTGRRLADAEIVDNLLTFLTAGHETTALALGWTLDLLGRHPAIARLLHEEAAAAVPGDPDALPLATRVFQEALRLYPAAPLFVRRVREPFVLAGERLDRNSLLVVPVHAIHRHRSLWDAPHVFDPDRFLPDAVAGRPRHAFLPFGAGPRTCIGASFAMREAVFILSVLMKELRFASIDPVPPAPRMEITLRPERPLMMRVERRLLH